MIMPTSCRIFKSVSLGFIFVLLSCLSSCTKDYGESISPSNRNPSVRPNPTSQSYPGNNHRKPAPCIYKGEEDSQFTDDFQEKTDSSYVGSRDGIID